MTSVQLAKPASKIWPLTSKILRWAFVLIAVLVAVFPFIWMLRTAITPQTFISGLDIIPRQIDFSAFERVWVGANMGQAVLTGILASLFILVIQLLTSLPAAFAFAKLNFWGRDAFFALVLVGLLIPAQAIAIPLFLGVSSVGLGNSFLGLVLPSTTTAFGLFLLRQSLLTLPDSLLDAAKMDGFSYWRILWKIVVPLSKPAIVTFSLFSIFGSWNEYFWPLLIARDTALRTPPLALAVFQNADAGFDYAALAAGAVIVTLPILILFIFARRNFIAGITGAETVG